MISLRVISGKYRGKIIKGYDIEGTRPTMDRVKESVFSTIQNYIPDSVVLDLFSGSGSIGIEFLSRGCKKAYMCDTSHKAINIIHQNLEKTRLTDNAIVMNQDFKACLNNLAKQKLEFDIIFIDPPYKDDIAVKSVEMILSLNLLKAEGIIIIETDELEREEENLKKLDVQIYDCRKYGRVNLIFLN